MRTVAVKVARWIRLLARRGRKRYRTQCSRSYFAFKGVWQSLHPELARKNLNRKGMQRVQYK